MATLPRRLWTSDRRGHRSPELAILFNDKNPHASTSTMVRISSRLQPHHPHPGKLRTKPDALTRQWEVYLKEGNSDYASVNPRNFCLVFTSEQLALSL